MEKIEHVSRACIHVYALPNFLWCIRQCVLALRTVDARLSAGTKGWITSNYCSNIKQKIGTRATLHWHEKGTILRERSVSDASSWNGTMITSNASVPWLAS